MPDTKSHILFTLVIVIFILVGCTYPGTAKPTPTPVPTQSGLATGEPAAVPVLISVGLPAENLKIGIYFDMSPIMRIPGGDVLLADGSTGHSDDFWGYLSLVSNQQYAACVKLGGCKPPNPVDNPQYSTPEFQGMPVVGVTPDEAELYCKWMNGVLPDSTQIKLMADALARSGEKLYLGQGERGFGYYVDDSSSAGDFSVENADGTLISHLSKNALNVGILCVIKGGGKTYAPMCNMKSINPQSTLYGINAVPAAAACKPEATYDLTSQYCQGGKPYVTVDVGGVDGPGMIVNVGNGVPFSCTADMGNSPAGKVREVCTGQSGGSGYVKAFVTCTTPADWQPGNICMDQYVYDPKINICIYTPGSDVIADNFCPVGYTYSSEVKCCAAVTKDYVPLCPPGQLYENDVDGCISYENLSKPSYYDVTLPECTVPPGGGGPAGCTLSCPAGMYPNSACTACTGKP